MNPGPTEEVAKVATGFIDSMKQQPLSLALVVMNICLLGFFYVILATIAAQREREIGLLYEDNKAVRDLLGKCVVPPKQSGEVIDPLPPFRQAGEPPRPPAAAEPERKAESLPLPPAILLPKPSAGFPTPN